MDAILSLALAALAIWGIHGTPVSVETGGMARDNIGAYAYTGTITQPCRIVLAPAWVTWDAAMQLDVLVHEVGHCWGLGHAERADSVMFWEYVPGSAWRPTSADYDALRALRPVLPYRAVAASVAR